MVFALYHWHPSSMNNDFDVVIAKWCQIIKKTPKSFFILTRLLTVWDCVTYVYTFMLQPLKTCGFVGTGAKQAAKWCSLHSPFLETFWITYCNNVATSVHSTTFVNVWELWSMCLWLQSVNKQNDICINMFALQNFDQGFYSFNSH